MSLIPCFFFDFYFEIFFFVFMTVDLFNHSQNSNHDNHYSANEKSFSLLVTFVIEARFTFLKASGKFDWYSICLKLLKFQPQNLLKVCLHHRHILWFQNHTQAHVNFKWFARLKYPFCRRNFFRIIKPIFWSENFV